MTATGDVVLESIVKEYGTFRALKGIDPEEFETMVAGVGRFADQFDDQLIAEFYMNQPELTNQVDSSGIQLPQTD